MGYTLTLKISTAALTQANSWTDPEGDLDGIKRPGQSAGDWNCIEQIKQLSSSAEERPTAPLLSRQAQPASVILICKGQFFASL